MKNIIIALLVVLVLGGVGGSVYVFSRTRNQNSRVINPAPSTSQSVSSTSASLVETLTLKNLGLARLAPYDATAGISGDMVISRDALRELDRGLKGFYVFGEPLEGDRTNPTFEFASVKADAKVIAAIDGTVAFIKSQPETNDFEVFLQPTVNSIWTVGYDHITNVAVKQGEAIHAGDLIGYATEQNNGLHRFEIQVNKDVQGTTTHICPSTLLDATVKDAVLAELATMQRAWETFSGKDLYAIEAQNPVGCLVPTLTPAQAEGR